MSTFFILLKKELTLELRRKESLGLVGALSILMGAVAGLGLQSAFLDPNEELQVFSVLIWVVFLFNGTLCVSRSLEYELEDMALEGLRLSGVGSATLYLSKCISNCVVILIGHLIACTTISCKNQTGIWFCFQAMRQSHSVSNP